MTFFRKLFLSIFVVATSCSAVLSVAAYLMIRANTTREFSAHYLRLGNVLAETFKQMEQRADGANRAALFYLADLEAREGLPTDAELNQLAQHLGINAFYVNDAQGNFIRSSDYPIEKQFDNLFAYCDGYRELLTTASRMETPIVPGAYLGIPAKFTMVPNHARTRILNAGFNFEYLGKTLYATVHDDPSIQALSLLAPDGRELGSITQEGALQVGRTREGEAPWVGVNVGDGLGEFSVKVPASITECCECSARGIQQGREGYHYLLRIKVSTNALMAELLQLRNRVLALFVVSSLSAFALAYLVSARLVKTLGEISQTAEEIVRSGDLDLRVAVPRGDDEIQRLARTFNRMLASLRDSQARLVDVARLRSIARLASQVAHDIRSPIAALDVVSTHAKDLPNTHRELIREANRRIRDIANNLLTQHKDQPFVETNQPTPELIVNAIESVLSEKRAQFADTNIEFNVDVGDSARSAFAGVDRALFKRVLSNLLNNAAEASANDASVTVCVEADRKIVHVRVVDEGCGIGPEKIASVMQGGYSSKASGSGIGFRSSIERVQSWGGSIRLTSRLGAGTVIHLDLPRTEPATWFAQRVSIDRKSTVVILDDDKFVGTLWTERLLATPGTKNIQVKSFRRCADFVDFFIHNRSTISCCFIDYEFVDDKRTGVDLVEQLDIAEQAYLVTSHDEDGEVRRRCERIGLPIIPKSYVTYVPIWVADEEDDDLVWCRTSGQYVTRP